MAEPKSSKLKLQGGKLLLLAVIGIATAGGVRVFDLGVFDLAAAAAKPQSTPGQASTASAATEALPRFDTISIKRSTGADPLGGVQFQPGGRLVATNIPLRPLFSLAYNLALSQGRGAIIGAPDWFESQRYNIEAKAEGNPPREQMIRMLQSLLAERFKLAVHHETRQLAVYALELAKPGKLGPQLTPHSDNAKCINTPQPAPGPGNPLPAYCGDFRVSGDGNGGLRETANAITMDRFSASLAQQLDRPVVDRTGLKGTFDLDVEFISQRVSLRNPVGTDNTASGFAGPPSIFTALQEQLGLKLESTTGPVDIVVIDHVEEPSAN